MGRRHPAVPARSTATTNKGPAPYTKSAASTAAQSPSPHSTYASRTSSPAPSQRPGPTCLDGSANYAITACRIHNGVPVQGIVDLPAYRVRVSVEGAELAVTGDTGRLPSFTPDTILTSPRHTDRTAALLPGRPIAAMPTASIKMTLVALGRARAAAYLPSPQGGAAPWDYAAAALAAHTAGGQVFAANGLDLAHSRPKIHAGWLATRNAPMTADLAPLMHPHL